MRWPWPRGRRRMSRRHRLRPRLLPFRGDENPVIIPRAPWAKCLLAFQTAAAALFPFLCGWKIFSNRTACINVVLFFGYRDGDEGTDEVVCIEIKLGGIAFVAFQFVEYHNIIKVTKIFACFVNSISVVIFEQIAGSFVNAMQTIEFF